LLDISGNSTTEFWMDFLCLPSFLKIFTFRPKNSIKIYFLRESKYFFPIKELINRSSNYEFYHLNNVIYAEEKLKEISFYEYLQKKIKIDTEEISKRCVQNSLKSSLLKGQEINFEKLQKYFERTLFDTLYHINELLALSKLISTSNERYFLLNNYLVLNYFRDTLSINIIYYKIPLGIVFNPLPRQFYEYDKKINGAKNYSSIKLCFEYFINWISTLMISGIHHERNDAIDDISIGVEIHRGSIISEQSNDLFWFESSHLDGKDIVAIGGTSHFIDKESERYLDINGIKKILPFSKRYLFYNANRLINPKKIWCLIKLCISSRILNIGLTLSLMLKYLFIRELKYWSDLKLHYFLMEVKKFEKYYINNGIRVVFSMVDGDITSFSKSQALERINGYYVSSHWSQFPMFLGDSYKYADVFCIWSTSCVSQFFDNKCGKINLPVGYLTDFSFNNYSILSKKLKDKFKNKFVITYFDGSFGNDNIFSLNMHVKMYQLFILLLKKYPKMILFLKPKRTEIFKEMQQYVPDLLKQEKNGRLVVFNNKITEKTSQETKIPPIYPGLASDLVIGLGISSAATECYFGGKMAFHVDLTGLSENNFRKTGNNQFIFKEIDDLEKAIINFINFTNQERLDMYNEAKPAYDDIEPFQDGKAYDRVGFILAQLLDNLRKKKSRADINLNLKETYNKYLNTEYNYYNFVS